MCEMRYIFRTAIVALQRSLTKKCTQAIEAEVEAEAKAHKDEYSPKSPSE